MAAARLLASVAAVAGALFVQYGKFAPEAEPSDPSTTLFRSLVQAKVLSESPRLMLFPPAPAVFAVIVTTAPLDDAVTTDDVAVVRLMASRRFAASVVVSVEVAKFWPVFVPSLPFRSVAPFPPVQENPVKPLDRVILLPADPAVEAVTVTVVVPPELAVASVLAELLEMTVAMLLAS